MFTLSASTYPSSISPTKSSRNSACSMSATCSTMSLPWVGVPDSPKVFKSVISPPLRLISRFIPGLSRASFSPRRRLLLQSRVRILFNERPNGVEPFRNLALYFFQFLGAEFPAVGPALRENVIFNLRLRSRTAHRDPRFVFEFEDRHLLFRNYVAFHVANGFFHEIGDAGHF